MFDSNPAPITRILAVDPVIAAIRARSVSTQLLGVAIDGRSGSGKSTVAQAVAQAVDAVILPCDDFVVPASVTRNGIAAPQSNGRQMPIS